MQTQGFVRRETSGITFYTCRALEEMPDLRHGFSTRQGGISLLPQNSLNLSMVPWDRGDNVRENRKRFLSVLELQNARLCTLSQVHSNRLHIIEENTRLGNSRLEGDALATQLQGVALAVEVADCFPILLADPRTGAIAAVHAGWRGTLARILVRAVARLSDAFGTDPANLRAAVGPGIGACCYEVGPEVAEQYMQGFSGIKVARRHPAEPGKYLLDLRLALEAQFRESGVPLENVFILDACTRCHATEFFSYRREGLRTGRMMGVIGKG